MEFLSYYILVLIHKRTKSGKMTTLFAFYLIKKSTYENSYVDKIKWHDLHFEHCKFFDIRNR